MDNNMIGYKTFLKRSIEIKSLKPVQIKENVKQCINVCTFLKEFTNLLIDCHTVHLLFSDDLLFDVL
jgi:hypothetical protein